MTQEQQQEQEQQVERPKGDPEAAKYRKQLREEQAKTATLTAQLQTIQGDLARSQLKGRLRNPDDFDSFIGLEKVLGEDGRVDQEKLDAAVDELLAERDYLAAAGPARPATRPRPAQGEQVPGPAAPDTRSAIDRAFPGDGGASWNSALDRFAESGPSARSKSTIRPAPVVKSDQAKGTAE